jgi:uncharacterized protein
MKIIIDADACPVKEISINIAKQHEIPVIMISDTAHQLSDDYCQIITVDKGNDSVDMKIISISLKDDIVITQDYGLASIILSKGAKVLHQSGLIYTNDNIDRLLFDRFLGQKVRRSGGRTSNIKKRTKEDDSKFVESLNQLIKSSMIK